MATDPKKMRLVILASATGTLLEWYDLLLAIILAKVLSNQLFPSGEDILKNTFQTRISQIFTKLCSNAVFAATA